MCPTPVGRIHTRVFALIPGAIVATIISLVTGNADWIVLVGVYLVMGVALDTCVYQWAVRYQPPWMTFTLAVVEWGLLLVLASVLELDIEIWAASVLYWIVWSLAVITKVVVFPIASLTYLESATEFRRIEWSIPPSQASVPLLAAGGASGPGPGLFEQAASEAAAPDAAPSERQPSPSGIHESPFVAIGGAALKLVEREPDAGRELVVRDELVIGRDGCDVNLADPLVSRRHAELASDGKGGLLITDLGSSNGTFVNETPITTERQLAAGEEVRIGDTVWSVEAGGGDAPAGVAAGAVTRVRGSIASPSADPMPSAIQRFPGFAVGSDPGPPVFEEPRGRRRASAARRLEATVISFGAVAASAIAVIAFLAAR